MVSRKQNYIKRPAIWVGAAVMVGSALGAFHAKTDWLYMILFIWLICICMCMIDRKWSIMLVCAACATLSFSYSFCVFEKRNATDDFGDEKHNIEAVVHAYDKISDNSIRYEMSNVVVDGNNVSSHVLVTVKNGDKLDIGDKIIFTAVLRIPNSTRNSKLFDYREYLADKGIYSVAYIDAKDVANVVKYENKDGTLYYNFKRFQLSVIERYRPFLTDKAFGIVNTITSGENVYMDSELYDVYRKTGVAHVLAISGLHVGFAAMFAAFIARRMRKHGVVYTIINIAVIWLYIAFSGFNISAVRAGMFFTFLSIGKMFKLRCDITNIAFITATIMLIINPLWIKSVSFQLSFAAVISIGILSPAISEFITEKIKFIPKNTASSISVVLAASIGVAMPIAYHYNTFSVASLVLNFVIVPLYGYIVLFSFLLTAASAFNVTILMKWFSVVLNGFEFITGRILSAAAGLKYSYINTVSPTIITILAFVIIVVVLSRERPAWIKSGCAAVLSCVFVIVATYVMPYSGITGMYRVSFIDVGQAECTLIVTPTNHTIMIDAGTSYGTDGAAKYTIVPYLLKHGNTKIDYLVISHAHSDHMGEVISVMSYVKVDNIVYYHRDGDEDAFDEINATARELDINVINMYYNRDIRVDNKTYITRVSDYYSDNDVNAQSLVISVKCSNNNLLFAGDMPKKGLDNIGDIDNVLIYKVAHHGSVNSVSDRIEEINPLYSVIFTKEGNSYSLPNEDAVLFYSKFSEVLLTEEHGEIRFEFNDEKVRYSTYFD